MSRCAACPAVHMCIPPDGGGDILFVGEAPGPDEEKNAIKHPPGMVFIGRTGQEVNEHYLPLAGMVRGRGVTFTNAIRCLPNTSKHKLDPKRPADLALLDSCVSHHLYPLIERGRWRLIVSMGAFALKAINPDLSLDLCHGHPQETPWGIPLFPMYHPALGMHSPKQMLHIRTDWIRLKRHLAGTLHIPVDDYPDPDYREVTDAEEIEALDPVQPLACDTESSPSLGPYCYTYSQSPGTGRLIRSDRADLLQALQRRMSAPDWRAPVLFHHWFYDYKVVAEMGITIPRHLIRDTLVRAFHLGNLPQGLKALSKRYLGMDMQDFEDLVKPYSQARVLDYYQQMAAIDWPKPEPELVRDDKTGLWKVYKPQGMNTKLKRFFTDFSKNPEKDVFNMWRENWEPQQAMIQEQLGPWPDMDIAHAPDDEALFYACRDADATGRLWPLMDYMESRVNTHLQEDWAA